jgi:hypothetical protein
MKKAAQQNHRTHLTALCLDLDIFHCTLDAAYMIQNLAASISNNFFMASMTIPSKVAITYGLS